MNKLQKVVNEKTQKEEIVLNRSSKKVRLLKKVTIELGDKSQVFDDVHAHEDALNYLIDAIMEQDEELRQLIIGRQRNAEGLITETFKRIKIQE